MELLILIINIFTVIALIVQFILIIATIRLLLKIYIHDKCNENIQRKIIAQIIKAEMERQKNHSLNIDNE